MIFYLRCAADVRPLTRTHQQQNQLLAQTHSSGRAMLATMTKISLLPWSFDSSLFHLDCGIMFHKYKFSINAPYGS